MVLFSWSVHLVRRSLRISAVKRPITCECDYEVVKPRPNERKSRNYRSAIRRSPDVKIYNSLSLSLSLSVEFSLPSILCFTLFVLGEYPILTA
ncbi:unnamed protein product [Victoria cruziana]